MAYRRYPERVVSSFLLARHLTSLAVALCLVVGSYVGAAAQAADPAPSPSPVPSSAIVDEPLAGTWDVLAFDAWDDGLEEPSPGVTLTAVLLPGGRLEGETGCGDYFGGYTLEGDRLGMGIISKGPDPCDVQTTEEAVRYSVALEAVVGWRPAELGVELLDASGDVRIVLARGGDQGLTGSWVVERYTRANGKPATPLADGPIELTFDADGNVLGSSGCRLLEGRYTSTRDQVVVAPVEATGLPCEGDARGQERRLLRILDEVVFWQRTSTRLVLADGSAAPLLEMRLVAGVAEDADPGASPAAGA